MLSQSFILSAQQQLTNRLIILPRKNHLIFISAKGRTCARVSDASAFPIELQVGRHRQRHICIAQNPVPA